MPRVGRKAVHGHGNARRPLAVSTEQVARREPGGGSRIQSTIVVRVLPNATSCFLNHVQAWRFNELFNHWVIPGHESLGTL